MFPLFAIVGGVISYAVIAVLAVVAIRYALKPTNDRLDEITQLLERTIARN